MNKTKFPKIIYKQLKAKVSGYYDRKTNKIIINTTPCSFGVEYEFYGLKGLIRDLTATILHELTHWGTNSMKGHNGKATLGNLFRTRRFLECDLWSLRIHSVLYDLQRTKPYKIYFDIEEVYTRLKKRVKV
jgi:hypothetical protein